MLFEFLSSKIISTLSATILPLPGLAERARGRSEGLSPSSMPLENDLRPLRTFDASDSPREVTAPVAPYLTLVADAFDASDTSENTSPNVSARCPDWSEDNEYWDRMDALRAAPTRGFVRWLRQHDVSGHLTQRELLANYGEFCWYANFKPLSDRSLLNQIKNHGIETMRPSATIVNGKLHRPTLYRLKTSQRRAA